MYSGRKDKMAVCAYDKKTAKVHFVWGVMGKKNTKGCLVLDKIRVDLFQMAVRKQY